MQHQPFSGDDLTLDAKVEFLSHAETYPCPADGVVSRETHMSWVFLTRDRVYKLKKPVRFPYLDFSTLARREAACRAEVRLNRRLAPDIYLDVIPLILTPTGLALGGEGTVKDWLVVMRRLDESQTMERAIIERRVEKRRLDQLADLLVQFYRTAPVSEPSSGAYLAEWYRSVAYNHRILTKQSLNLPAGVVARINSIQIRFMKLRTRELSKRVRQHAIVDGHGDLRPEHIWLGDPVRIIDRLEFNPRLRAVDPFDEIAFLGVECERLGIRQVGEYIKRQVMRRLRHVPPEELFVFYRCHRAALRARLAIAHLLESNPRTPEKWPRVARSYLRIAAADAVKLERFLKKRANPRASRRRAVV